jgi:nucleotide-binding universal stress UspA family protein
MKNQDFPFRNILVATDFSEHSGAALGRALGLATRTGAAITAMHIVSDVASAVPGTSFAGHWRIPSADLKKAEQTLTMQAEERLAVWIAPFRKQQKKLQTEVLVGVPFVEIIRAVREEQYDLVLTGTRGHGALGRLLVGSTAERLVRKCPCPVWIVHPEHEWPLKSILAPVDFTEASAKSLRIACALAKVWDCTLTVLYVFDYPEDEIVTIPAGMSPGEVRRVTRQHAAQQLRDFAAQHARAVDIVQQLGVGIPWQMIVRVANRTDAGLIVMGSVGRTGIPGFLIGNTAEKVLRHCDRSILTVKPDGFVSPVK